MACYRTSDESDHWPIYTSPGLNEKKIKEYRHQQFDYETKTAAKKYHVLFLHGKEREK